MLEPVRSSVLFRGRWTEVVEEEWPDAGTWEVFKPKDAAAVLPVTPNGDVVLIRQFRAGARSLIEEIPAGLLDVEGEAPLAAPPQQRVLNQNL